MKYKVSFIIALCLSTFPTQTIDMSNPLNKWGGHAKNSYQGNTYWIAQRTKDIINKTPITKKAQVALKKQGIKLPANPIWTWEIAIQTGYFKNALYLRMLLSEFYCARCAIGASAFYNSSIQQQPLLAITPHPITINLASEDQPTPTLLPGGFDLTEINDWIGNAKRFALELKAERKKIESGVLVSSVNPLDSFAGVIIAPSKTFIKNLNRPQVGNIVISYPTFYSYQRPSKTIRKAQSNSSAISSTSLTVSPGTLPPTASEDSTKELNSINITLPATIQPTGKNSSTHTLCNLTLTSYNPNIQTEGSQGKSEKLSCYLKSITGIIGTGSDKSNIDIKIFNKIIPPTIEQQELINFFKKTPSIPWALVIVIDGSITGENITVTPHIKAIVKLNSNSFSQYTKKHSNPNLNPFLQMPQKLYSMIKDTSPGTVTPTACLLRGIANGYLTSWGYYQIVKPNLKEWETTSSYMASYPSPSKKQFETLGNRGPNNYQPYTMLYALYGTRTALNHMYLTASGIPKILDIIKNPSAPQPGFNMFSSEVSNAINTTIAKLGGTHTTPVAPKKTIKPTATSSKTNRKGSTHTAKTTNSTVTRSKPNRKRSSKNLNTKSSNTSNANTRTNSPKTTHHISSTASAKAYRKGYRAGQATESYKRGYQKGQEIAQNSDNNNDQEQNERNL